MFPLNRAYFIIIYYITKRYINFITLLLPISATYTSFLFGPAIVLFIVCLCVDDVSADSNLIAYSRNIITIK